MSTAPSSIPPPSFDVAPELPEGVERPPRPEGTLWKPWMAWAALVAAFGGALMGALIIGVIGSAAGSSFADASPAVSISAPIVQDLSFIGAALLFASISARPLPEQFGLRPPAFWPAVGWMAVAFAAFYVFTLIWVAILGVSPDDTKLPDELGVKDSTYALLAVAFLVAVVAPMAEEFFFRGFYYGALRNWRGPWPAAALTGLGPCATGGAPGRRRPSPGWCSEPSTSGRPRPLSCCRWGSSASRFACCASAPDRCIPGSPCTA